MQIHKLNAHFSEISNDDNKLENGDLARRKNTNRISEINNMRCHFQCMIMIFDKILQLHVFWFYNVWRRIFREDHVELGLNLQIEV